MIDLSSYLIPQYIVMLLLVEAITGCILMIRSRHHLVLIPIVCALGWMLMAYLLHLVGLIDDVSRIAMLRAGLTVMCITFVIGAAIYLEQHDR